MTTTDSQKPFILYCAPFPEGHTTPALQICSHLWANDVDSNKLVELAFVDSLPSALNTLRFALSKLNERDPERKIVILSDTTYPGTLGYKMLGERGIPPGFKGPVPKTIGISVVPAMFTSVDSGPMGAALGFDQSDAGRARNKLVARLFYRFGKGPETMRQRLKDVLLQYGITKSVDELFAGHSELIDHYVGDAVYVCHDTTLQMCIPSLEFPYSDLPSHIKFAGTLPVKPISPDLVYPDWFKEITENGTKATGKRTKKVVMVAQGTMELDYDLLVVPTMLALAEREDIVVVVVLCARGATLESKLEQFPRRAIPANVRVVDYFPYDAILEHADVFVTQSGYGGFSHAIVNGVPMIQSGVKIDKPEIGLRAERAGLGVYLWNAPPRPEQVSEAVDKEEYYLGTGNREE
ncbi:UDP-Glycosyltransferase/glycogen phosphorylase [Thozetella sp. PMI_491]|nr:UDP-Glycosyltransferase/glycogen phosphorylase [Thozetella sp. PMI_491]